MTETRARELAGEFSRNAGRTLSSDVKELEQGWYFGWQDDGGIGSHGLAVSKTTGSIFVFGSAFTVERDLFMYDRGMDAAKHDLVIVEVADVDATLNLLRQIAPTVVDLSYETGVVWRTPRRLSEDELRSRLSHLPAIFPDLALYFAFEAIEAARASGCCVINLIPRGQ